MALPADRKFGKFSELCYTLYEDSRNRQVMLTRKETPGERENPPIGSTVLGT